MILRTATWPDGMCGPASDAPGALVEPPLRPGAGLLEFRYPFVHRFSLAGLAGLAGLLALVGTGGVLRILASLAALVLGAGAWRVATWRPLVDERGWHHGTGVIAWEQLEVIKVHAGRPGQALVKTRDGVHRSMWANLPTSGPAGRFGSEEAIGRLAHQVAHQVHRPPVPVIVGGGGTPVRFLDPRCAVCAVSASLGADN